MARVKQGILDGPSGTAGPTVWCHGKKRHAYVRARPLVYNDKKSRAQLENRARMKTIMAFLSKAKEFANHNLDHLTKHESATNRATSMNYYKVRFGERVIEGGRHGGKIVADYKNSNPIYNELVLSEGSLFGLDSAVVLLEGGALVMAWSDFECEGRSQSTDKVNVFVYNATKHLGWTELNAGVRSAEQLRIALPEKWEEDDLHVYVSVSNKWESDFSESQYFEMTKDKKLKAEEGWEEDLSIGIAENLEANGLGSEKSAIKVLYQCYQSAVTAGAENGVRSVELGGNGASAEECGVSMTEKESIGRPKRE